MQVEFSPTALRNIQNLPEKIAMACVEFIYGPLAENPRRVGVFHLEHPADGHSRVRRPLTKPSSED